MTSLTDEPRPVVGGVDTHKDLHVAVVINDIGRVLGTETFETTPRGYRRLLRWMRGHGEVRVVGVEGTGSWGAGLASHLAAEQVAVVEVDRPNRQLRRRRGKSDPVDAEHAARAALSGEASGSPKSKDGPVEMMRSLRVVRRSAIKARAQASNQLHALVDSAPEPIRARLRDLTVAALVAKASRFRTSRLDTPADAVRLALHELAQRWLHLDAQIERLDDRLAEILAAFAPQLLARQGVGTDVAGALLVAAGDNPHRLRSEASFAALCGVSPVDASSGRNQRHRLNRGGDRQANNALWRIALVRMSHDPRTRDYIARRIAQGKTKKEAIRCLKRYIAREIYNDLRSLTT
jgi:transposase